MFDEAVWYAQAGYMLGIAVVGQPFQYGRAEAAVQCTVLYGDYVVVVLCHLLHDVGVQGLE